jgi:hypothetical protein
MRSDKHPLDYSSSPDAPTSSWLAYGSLVVGLLAFPCIANLLIPDALHALLPRGTRQSAPPTHLLILPALSILLGILAVIRIGASRRKRQGMTLALCGIAFGLCWSAVVLVGWLVTRNLKFGPAD